MAEHLQLRLGSDSDATGHQIAYASGHGKTRHLFVLEPDPERPEELRLAKFGFPAECASNHHVWGESALLDAAVFLQNASRLVLQIRFMISA